ncbi:MAG: hypothetical protein HC827_06905 [Cyanobacteria bacterium RM1_2_2]|nr:hypothetical protein [Cyanobacteria bacterium RM1_2_2]
MRSLFRWSKTLGWVGGILLGSLIASSLPVLALTDEEVIQRLRPVPVFTLANEQNNLLLLRCPGQNEGETVQCIYVFIGPQDAQGFLAGLRRENAEIGGEVEVLPLSLAQIYQEMTQEREDPLVVRFIPTEQDVEAARTILQQNGSNPDEFRGVPLFVARSGGQDDEVYLSNERDGEVYIPMFFSQAQLQQQIDRLKQEKPELVSSVRVQVWSLESIIQAFHTQDNEGLTQLEFVPYPESYDFVRSLEAAPQNPAPQVQPAPQQ